MSIYLEDNKKIKQNCEILVKPNSQLPKADYLTNGQWIVTTTSKLVFTIVCTTELNPNTQSRVRTGNIIDIQVKYDTSISCGEFYACRIWNSNVSRV